jgi:hypothetical protein
MVLKVWHGRGKDLYKFILECKRKWQPKTTDSWYVHKVIGEVGVASRGQEIVSVASRVVKPKRDELRPAVSKELY